MIDETDDDWMPQGRRMNRLQSKDWQQWIAG